MELVGVFSPTVADVGAVVHVGDEDVFNAGVDLGLGLFHGLAGADDGEDDAGGARDEPLAVDLFYVLDVDLLGSAFLKNDGVILGEGFEGGVVVEREWRDDDAHADLKAAAGAP